MQLLSDFAETQARAVQIFRKGFVQHRLHHALLFVGTDASACFRLAEAAANVLVCQSPQDAEACHVCSSCLHFQKQVHPDVIRMNPDEKENIGIDVIRQGCSRLFLRAMEAPAKVALLKQIDSAQSAAQNALLKALEEPPLQTFFLLTATRLPTLLATLRSRCQIIRLCAEQKDDTWQALVSLGVDKACAKMIASFATSGKDQAVTLYERGVIDIVRKIDEVLGTAPFKKLGDESDQAQKCVGQDNATLPLDILLDIATELTATKEKTALSWLVLEHKIRDCMARAFGANANTDSIAERFPDAHTLSAAAKKLQQLRKMRNFNPNPTLAMETLLLLLGRKTPIIVAGSC